MNMVTKKTWKEFRKTGLLFYINQILHVFGWAIVLDIDNDEVIDAYPARVRFRGFGDKQIEEGYYKVSLYLQDNIDELVKEAAE